jgi:hypothetical protein
MCDVALIFHTSFEEMEGWSVDTLAARRNRAVELAKVIYGGN